MRGIRDPYRASVARLAVAVIGILFACLPLPATAKPVRLNSVLCHAVTALGEADTVASSLRFACAGTPQGYQQGSLWLRADLRRLPVDRSDVVLMVHHSRFDRLAVLFSYADGARQWQQVRSGDYGSHWRAGGQIAFEAPVRTAPLVAITLRFDKVASSGLLQTRLLTRGQSGLQSAALGAIIGAALTLLLIGLLYNLSLAFAVRRQFLAWQGGWAGCMLLWGLIWSEMHLLVVPGMAGTLSAQTCTFLSCMAVMLATGSVATSLEQGAVARWARVAMLITGTTIGLLGIPLTLLRSAALETLGAVTGVLILADLLLVALSLGWAWRRGSDEARDFAKAWALPMATLALIQFVDIEGAFWGGGSKIIILLAAAWQTLWLSIAASRRFAHLRIERDHALAAEAQANELARRDPLTGLHNRRGFVEAIEPLLQRAHSETVPAALLLIDIDRFKSINDVHGHEAGDMVLRCIGARLQRWEGPMCAVGRLGGEEFALMIVGLDGFALGRFAESVRQEIAACDHSAAIGDGSVTVSIGVAETRAPGDFQQLFRVADQGLYAAKRQGRNRVVARKFALVPTDGAEPPAALQAPY